MKNTYAQQKQTSAIKAIDLAGGQTELAKWLSAELNQDVKPSRVQKWPKIGIPVEFVKLVHKRTSVPLFELAPDLFTKEECLAIQRYMEKKKTTNSKHPTTN